MFIPLRDFLQAAKAIALLHSINIFLGHGRALESALVFVKFLYWLMLTVIPEERTQFIAFQDVRGIVPGFLLALPYLAAATLSFTGLALNACGNHRSRYYRIFGASTGMSIWLFILLKDYVHGVYMAGLHPWCIMAIFADVWIIHRGYLGLPRPGAPGQV